MKRLLITLLSLLLILLPTVIASAAPVEDDVIYLSSSKSIVFWVEWDVEKPSVIFIAPDGTEMNPDAENPDTVTVFGDDCLFYTVYNAAAGQWKIRYDKGNNNEIEVTVSDYFAGISVDHFSHGDINNDRMDVSFLITGEDNTYVDYRISAIIDASGGEKLLKTGSCRIGENITETVDLSSLTSYSKYKLKLYAYYNKDGTDIFDFAYTDEFAYTNSRTDNIQFDYNVTVLPNSNTVRVNWSGNEIRNIEKVLVAIFEGDASEPAIFDIYDPSYEEKEFAFNPSAGKYTVEVTLTVDGINSNPLRKTFDLSAQHIALPDADSTNTLSLPVKYSGFKDCLTKVTVNNKQNDLVLNGDGAFTAELQDDWNQIKFEFTDKNGINWIYEKKLFVDRIAPILTMSRNYDGINTEDTKISINGNTVDGYTLTINGEAVTLAADGSFAKEITLKKGENVVTVVATDVAGNKTVYTANIVCGSTWVDVNENQNEDTADNLIDKVFSDNNYYVLIIVSVFCILIIIYAAIFWRRKKEKKEEENIEKE